MILYCLYYGNSHPQKEEAFFCRKKKASRFIDIREASCIRKMTCRANSAGKLSGEDKDKLKLHAWSSALLPFAAFLQKLDTFKTLQDGTLAAYGTGCFEAGMLGHDLMFVKGSEKYFTPALAVAGGIL